jgi:hypothetical protein
MKRLHRSYAKYLTAVMISVLLGLILAACAPRIVLDPGIPSSVTSIPSSVANAAAAVPTGNADAQFIQPDDYFYLEEPWTSTNWEYVKLGKLVTAPTPETKNQAEFMSSVNGSKEWAKWWVKTRIATRSDLALGKEVICFNDHSDGDIYLPPESNQSARNDSWFVARITDMSELFKGYVLVTDGYKISEKNLRVIIK